MWWRNSKSPLKLDSESKDNRIRKLIRGRRERHSPVSLSDGDGSRRHLLLLPRRTGATPSALYRYFADTTVEKPTYMT